MCGASKLRRLPSVQPREHCDKGLGGHDNNAEFALNEQTLIQHSHRSFVKVLAGDGELLLCAARAAFDPIRRALFVADVHLGKALSFRSLGVPVPGGTTALALTRLGDLIGEVKAQTVFILGDLLHGPAVRDSGVIEQLTSWRHQYPDVRMVLVRGNHDHRAGDPPDRCGIEIVAEGVREGPWFLCHESGPEKSGYVLVGTCPSGLSPERPSRQRPVASISDWPARRSVASIW